MNDIRRVLWSPRVERQLERVPEHIQRKFLFWIASVKELGVRKVRERVGFHDEPLKGSSKGKRSIRLNRSYRAIYIEVSEAIIIIGVTKHEY